MNLLEDTKIKELFCCPLPPNTVEFPLRQCQCLGSHIIEAMMQPIEVGDRVVYISSTGHAEDKIAKTDGSDEAFHPYALKVPDRFQKKCCDYDTWGESMKSGGVYSLCEKHFYQVTKKTLPCFKDLVEEKIQEIFSLDMTMRGHIFGHLEKKLGELVELVRKEK